jgi:hypothetical protein
LYNQPESILYGDQPTVFDLFLYLLNLEDGHELPDMPGHLVSSAPRRVSRNRSGDMLSALLTPAARGLIPAEDLQELLLRLAGEYFASAGSVTNGIRTAVDIINDLLINSSWLADSGGGQTAGTLNLAVLHTNSLFIAHVGATHSILFSRERVADMYDPPVHGSGSLQPEIAGLTQESVSGLGAARTIQPRFYQQEIASGDLLIQCAKPPSFWSENELKGSANLAVDGLRRRLLLHPPLELYAALMQFSGGKGEIHRLEPRKPERQAQISFEDNIFSSEGEDALDLNGGSLPQARPPARPPFRFAENLTLPGVEAGTPGPGSENEAPAGRETEEVQEKMVLPLPDLSLAAWQERADRLVDFFQSIPERTRRIFISSRPKFNPGVLVRTGPSGSFPAATLLFIAIAIPVLVVAIATTIYFRSGKSEQRQAYLLAAQQTALQAAGEMDAAVQRDLWEQSLHWVIKAEEFGQTDDTRYLYQQALYAIDTLDGVVRLPMQLAVATGLPSGVEVTRIAASSEDVFLLNGRGGNIIRLTLTDLGFQVDPKFNCGPGPSGAKTIGPLIDMFVLPPDNQFSASLVAIDRSGNLLYCMPGKTPLVTTLTPPDLGWGRITAIAHANNTLYILDPPSKAVQRFGGSDYAFGGSPHLFFDEQIPKLDDVIDLTVYQDDLYLLHKSGQTTVCTYSAFAFSPTRCSDPAPYGKAGSGDEITSFPGVYFTQILSTQPPDPSLYFLDDAGSSIYHFSLRLNLQNRYRFEAYQDSPRPENPLTALDFSANRVVYLAFRDRVYYSTIP